MSECKSTGAPNADVATSIWRQLESNGLIELNPYADSALISKTMIEVSNAFGEGGSVVRVGSDGIHMRTLNGDTLLDSCPSVGEVYRYTLDLLRRSMPDLHEIPQRPVGISANLLQGQSDRFRMHFDRHQVTAIVYLNDAPSMPLVVYPNVREDPILTGTKGTFDLGTMAPRVIEPRTNAGLVFLGRRCFHGVENRGKQANASEQVTRYSLQFGFDVDPCDYAGQSYYGAN